MSNHGLTERDQKLVRVLGEVTCRFVAYGLLIGLLIGFALGRYG